METKTKIYGTLGPACARADCLEKMLRLGMTGLRLNLSHSSLREAESALEELRLASTRCGLPAELLIDMQGPELRIGALETPMLLRAGETVPLERIPLPEELREKIAPAQELLLDDGKLLLTALRGGMAHVNRGGLLQSRKSVAAPGLKLTLPALTACDRANLLAARDYGVTGVMQPFVRSRADLEELRRSLDEAGGERIRIYAKIENRQGMEKLPELIETADEIVIARGDLGNAMPLWELPCAQKTIAARCRAAGRDFMVVTQMLASMEQNAVPTRAEVSDIFNAVQDGARSVMVTGETASGRYPVETIRYLVNTVRAAEHYLTETGGKI